MFRLKVKLKPGQKGIPVGYFKRSTSALQTAIFEVAGFISLKEPHRLQRRLSKEVREQSSLEIITIKEGSKEIYFDISTEPQIVPTIGKDAINKILQFSSAIGARDFRRAKNIIPDNIVRKRLACSLGDLNPRGETGEASILNENIMQRIDSVWEQTAKEFLIPPVPLEKIEIIGQLVGLKIIHPLSLVVLYGNRPYTLHYKEEYIDTLISEFSKIVRLTCEGYIDPDIGKLAIEKLVDIDIIDEPEFHSGIIEWQNKIFFLSEPIFCRIEREKGYVSVKCEELGIIADGEKFNEAWANFREEFSFIYKEYGLASDEKLTTKARELKRIINKIVEKV